MSEDANEIVIDALADLLTRDVMKLLSSGETEQARALMKMGGVSEEDLIEELIKEGETE
tara:strand:- start:382 stop:558 length:177 start_codon:yes stop_codon:yes gene_type:complete